MPVFYFLHEVLPNSETFKEGKRNSATFLFGSFIYAIIYVIIKNLQLKYGKFIDSILPAFTMILIADMCTMAYTYKIYYGRNIFYELKDENQEDWVFNEKIHKYIKPTEVEKLASQLQKTKDQIKMKEKYQDEINKLNDKLAAKKRIKEVSTNKKRVKAAKVIQRWWREKLYNPPNGIFYKKALQSFEENKL